MSALLSEPKKSGFAFESRWFRALIVHLLIGAAVLLANHIYQVLSVGLGMHYGFAATTILIAYLIGSGAGYWVGTTRFKDQAQVVSQDLIKPDQIKQFMQALRDDRTLLDNIGNGWEELNDRRCELIRKDVEAQLSDAEKQELDRLEGMTDDRLQILKLLNPPPPPSEIDLTYERLQQEAKIPA